MQKLIYETVKTILEETPFVSFEANDEAMTFTCNQFDRPIVLAINNTKSRNIFALEKTNPDQILHVIHTEVTSIFKVKGVDMEKIEPKLRVLLNTIRMNFLRESIHCIITDVDTCYFVERCVPRVMHGLGEIYTYYVVRDTGELGITNRGWEHNFSTPEFYCDEDLMELDVINFFRENMYNEEIFTKY